MVKIVKKIQRIIEYKKNKVIYFNNATNKIANLYIPRRKIKDLRINNKIGNYKKNNFINYFKRNFKNNYANNENKINRTNSKVNCSFSNKRYLREIDEEDKIKR